MAQLDNFYDVIYSTKRGVTMIAKRVPAPTEAKAKAKVRKEMRASTTFKKILMVVKR